MSITKEQVQKVAKLARIRVSDDECDKFAGELSNIFDWIEQLQEVDTDGVEPMSGVGSNSLRLREDAVTGGGDASRVLSNAPRAEFDCYAVPKVVE